MIAEKANLGTSKISLALMDYRPFLKFASAFITRSRALTLELWEADELDMELKKDSTPVTQLDREIEVLFREEVQSHYPSHGVLGEEYGLSGGEGEFVWVIDPIDGTQSLVNRVPTFGTFLALMHRGEAVLGMIDIPVLGRHVAGALGAGVTDERGRAIDLSGAGPLTPTDIVAVGTTACFRMNGDTALQERVLAAFPLSRSYYDCFGHYLVALGGVAGILEMNVPSWDVVATEALVRAAGGAVHHLSKDPSLTGRRSTILGRAAVVNAIRDVIEG